MKILKKSIFSENLSKIIIKVTKKALILNKNLISVTRRAGCLIPTRRVIRCQGNLHFSGLRHIGKAKDLKFKINDVLYIQI